eukprot:c2057_g1_i1.p1 GENE.c2057_g1_i1~~c2057_g1_i1.p1  ORF type:complete len:1364 (-),score=380.71 c2057_g1_i1:181-4272(-)
MGVRLQMLGLVGDKKTEAKSAAAPASAVKPAAAGAAGAVPAVPEGDVVFIPGSYQIQVHVIEARDLKASSPSPKVIVEVMDTKKSTPAVQGTFSPFFDHVLFWELPDMTLDHFEYGKINLSVFDSSTALRSKMIGSYEFDVMSVYTRPNHEIHRSWLALTDPTDEREGVQGMLRVSISVIGPNDTPVHHDEADDAKEDTGPLLMPPRMKTEDHILILQIHKAEHLPVVDTAILGIGGASIDPYIKVEFAGLEAKTHAINESQNPIFCDQLEIPITLPCMSDRIIITLMDKDKVGDDDVIGMTRLRFNTVPCLAEGPDLKKPREGGGHEPIPPKALTRWINLYGPRGGLDNPQAMQMRLGTSRGSTYLGRVLLSVWEMKYEGPKLAVKKLNTATSPPDQKWTARLNLLQGAQLPFGEEALAVELSWVNMSKSSTKQKGKNGITTWNEALDVEVSVSPTAIPDLFIYLKYGEKRVGYIRYDLKKTENMRLTVPTWDDLEVDSCYDDMKKYTSAGEILFCMHVAPSDKIGERPPIMRPSFMPCTLHCYLYAARELPALDTQSGAMDPYLVITFCGVSIKFSTKPNTLFPVWNEYRSMNVNVINPMDIAPKINGLIFDSDQIGSDEFAGLFQVDVSMLNDTTTKIEPKWHRLERRGKACPGAVLIGFDLVPLTNTIFSPPKSITPPSTERLLEFTIIGLRNLAPFNLLKIDKSYIVCELYDKKYRTKKYSKPSGSSPNYLEFVELLISVPNNPLYTEPLQVTVFEDRLLGGQTKIATCTISLEPYYDASKAKKSSVFVKHLDDSDNDDTLKGPALIAAEDTKESEKLSLLSPTTQKSDSLTVPGTGSAGDVFLTVPDPSAGASSSSPPTSAGTRPNATSSTSTRSRSPSTGSNMGDEVPEATKAAHEEEASAPYMQGRPIVRKELEKSFKMLPFHTEPLLRYSTYDKPPKVVGSMKCNLFLLPPNAPAHYPRPFSHAEFEQPRHYVVRVYIIRGIKLTAKDENGLSDPCLEIKLGRTKIFDESSLRPRTIDPEFHCKYELNCVLPGQSQLTVNVYDKDNLGYELIGKTEIDLENYFFNEEWHKYDKKPLEKRTLKSDLTPTPQGSLEMWVDIIDPRLRGVMPMTNIDPPKKVPFQMRVVIWKARNVPAGDFGKMNDMYISVELNGNGKVQKQDTDVHWRSSDGKGNFNYRMMFDIELPMKKPRLKFQVWDQDIIGANDALGEATISSTTLQRAMVAAYSNMTSAWLHLDAKADPLKMDPQAEWIQFASPESGSAGKVLVTVEFLPLELVTRKPAGVGRKDPNTNPYLPPPVRVEWNLLRPDLMIAKLLGPEFSGWLKKGILCAICCILFAFFLYFFGQLASILGLFI